MTADEKAAEEKGELIFSYGDSDINVSTLEVKSVRWTDKELSFMLMQMGGELSAGEMAHEIIDG